MAVVTRADCTQIAADEDVVLKFSPTENTLIADVKINDLNFNACTGIDANGNASNNNLQSRVRKLNADSVDHISNEVKAAVDQVLVGSAAGKCNEAIETFLGTKNITRISNTATS